MLTTKTIGGIGPADQLAVVAQSTDGPTMISKDSWIELPVGYNLADHLNVSTSPLSRQREPGSHELNSDVQTDTYVTHPGFVFYDFYEAWTNPNPEDKKKYLGTCPPGDEGDKRSGADAT